MRITFRLIHLAIVLAFVLSLPSSGVDTAGLTIPRLSIDHDEDGDGLPDLEDILEGARKDAANKPVYCDAYYRGGYPPADEGVCTDVIWRAFRNAGYDLKKMVDEDIRRNMSAYPRVGGHPDLNIDFRRVANLIRFFERRATVLTNKLIPHDPRNLGEWQGGDVHHEFLLKSSLVVISWCLSICSKRWKSISLLKARLTLVLSMVSSARILRK